MSQNSYQEDLQAVPPALIKSPYITSLNSICQHVSLLCHHPFPEEESFSIFLDATQAHSSCRQLPALHCLSNEPPIIQTSYGLISIFILCTEFS